MIRVNYIGTAGGVGVTTLTLASALVTHGMAVERTNKGDMAAALGVMDVPDDVFRHRFGDERIIFADCGRDLPAPPGSWLNVLVVPRRYLGLRNVHPMLLSGTQIHGYVDVSTEVDVLSLADVRANLAGIPHLGSMKHSATVARVIDAGLMNTRLPRHVVAEATAITDAITELTEEHS